MRVLQPLHELGIRLRFGGGTRNCAVGLKDLSPEGNILFGRLVRSEGGTPPVREALESRALRRCKPADDVVRFFRHGRRILVIRSHKRVDDVLFRLGVIGVFARGVNGVCHGSRSPCQHRRFDFRFYRDAELSVMSLIERRPVNAVSHGVTVNSVEGKRYVLVDAIALGTVPVLAADHGALQHIGLLFCPGISTHNSGAVSEVTNLIPLILRESDNSNSTLIAGGVAAARINGTGGVRFIYAAVRVGGLHCVGVFGADVEHGGNENRLVVVRGKRRGLIVCQLLRCTRRSRCLPFQSNSQNLRELFATSGSPAENTQTSPLTQIILFRHTRL